MTPTTQWQRFQQFFLQNETLGVSLDISRMNFGADFFEHMSGPIENAFTAMDALEAGAIANPDEQRMVGHYWLRDAGRAPQAEIRNEIETTNARIKKFAADVHSGALKGASGAFSEFLLIGIGGSALGPQLVADALGSGHDKLAPHFLDNTDPDGIARVLTGLASRLGQTLVIVISKSGGTAETRNGMLAAKAAYEAAGLNFSNHAVAVTGEGSALAKQAESEKWSAIFPMWDWVGGRTSVLSAVGLVPAALQGIDIDALLAGAAAMDAATRVHDTLRNPAMLLALMWYYVGGGRGDKAMFVLPYKDRLLLFSRYLQQLVMESLGKKDDLAGQEVHQGIAVYGNKGSTDQHAYVQQLRDGRNDFFATFVEVLKDDAGSHPGSKAAPTPNLGGDVALGDYLQGFYLGTRRALHEGGRESVTITLRELNERTLAMLIALFERAVGFYATLININAYHQPGVEAGKKAAAAVLDVQAKLLKAMADHKGTTKTASEWAEAADAPDDAETVFKLLERLAANCAHGIVKLSAAGHPAQAKFTIR